MFNKLYIQITKGIMGDALLNVIATAILTIGSQIIVYPFLSREMSAEAYGTFLTTIGIINTVSVSFGNTLNISRLLSQPEYVKSKTRGDFNLLFIRISGYITLILMIIFAVIQRKSLLESGILVLLAILVAFRSYYVVDFRINLNYKKLIYMNALGVLGYFVGIFLFPFSNSWILLFVISELFSCLYLVFRTETVKEPLSKTVLYKQISERYYTLLLSAFVSNSSQYLDRFLINPSLGPAEVSIYTVASFLGKSLNLLISPINSVILAYSVNEKNITLKKLYKRLIVYAVIYLLMYVLIIIFGPSVLCILYPTIIKDAMPYFAIANLSTLIMGYGGTLMQLLLRYGKAKWQLFINVSYLIVYIISSLVGLYLWGLLGFSIAILLSNSARVIVMLIIIIKSVKTS